jgi:hypothetical protein
MKREISTIWMKAAVTGGLWASFEIIVGSLLHNLHIPFSGTLLAAFSVVLMISFLQLWNESGLIWRAGLICGLMKSLSPSAVILGPMTGIMMEAAIMDLVIFLVGKNLVGYILAGTGAVLSALLHKLINLFILYGTDLIGIYLNFFNFLKKQLGIENVEAGNLLAGILVAYIALGSIAAVSGYLLGRYALKTRNETAPLDRPVDLMASSWIQPGPGLKFSIGLLFIHLVLLPGLLLLINFYGTGPEALVPFLFYMVFLLTRYKRILGRLKKPFFWTQLIIMMMVAVFFWKPPDEGGFALEQGLLVGLEMCIRAILVVSAFSAFSVEIRNPRVTATLLNLGFSGAYASLSLAFNSLPAMIDRSAGFRTFIRRPLRSFSILISEAENWLKCYQTQLKDTI